MSKARSTNPKRIFFPSLEGVLGYAFLAVFFAHYATFSPPFVDFKLWMFPFLLIERIIWIGIPRQRSRFSAS